MVAVLSSPEICKSPDLPLSMSGRPATLSIPGSPPALTAFAPASASFAEEPGFLCLAGATFAPRGSAGAAPGSINWALAPFAARTTAKRPQMRGRSRRVIGEI